MSVFAATLRYKERLLCLQQSRTTASSPQTKVDMNSLRKSLDRGTTSAARDTFATRVRTLSPPAAYGTYV